MTRYPDNEWGDGYLRSWADRVARVIAWAWIYAGRLALLLTVAVVLMCVLTHDLWEPGRATADDYAWITELTGVVVALFFIFSPFLLLPFSPEAMVNREGGRLNGRTVLGPRSMSADHIRARLFWFRFWWTHPRQDVWLLHDGRYRFILVRTENPFYYGTDNEPTADDSLALVEPDEARPPGQPRPDETSRDWNDCLDYPVGSGRVFAVVRALAAALVHLTIIVVGWISICTALGLLNIWF